MSAPALSIVMPAHNAGTTIGEAIASVQRQSERCWELIVVDDGSDDRGPSVVDEIASDDPRVRLLRRPRGGRSSARNAGIDEAVGEHVMFLDADDLLEESAVASLLAGARRSACGAVYGAWRHIDLAGAPLDSSGRVEGEMTLDRLLSMDVFLIHSQIIRRDVLGEARFDPRLSSCEDLDLWLRLATRGIRWEPVDPCVAVYRLGPRTRSVALFKAMAGVLERGYARARESANIASDIDVSGERESRVLERAAFDFAHLMLLDDPTPSKERAAGVLRSLTRSGTRALCPLSPNAGADLALSHLPLSEERGRDAWRGSLERYTAHAAAWWSRVEREGWGEQGFARRAMDVLVFLLCNEIGDVAERLVERAASSERIVVLGLGRNGVRVARALHRRGIEVVARDDGLDRARAQERLGDIPVRFIESTEAFDPGAVHIMSVLDDGAYLGSLPDGLRVVRWREVASEAEGEIRTRIRASLAVRELKPQPEGASERRAG